MITPRIETFTEKKLIGKKIPMSLTQNRTGELWGSFMPQRKQILNTVSNELYSLQVYPAGYFETFDPARPFDKWALAEVSDHDQAPEGFEVFTLPGGLYAVFHYVGSNQDARIFQYIFGVWLPGSGYTLDDRPHFEILGEKYRNNDPASEEDIFIPVRLK